MPGEQFRIAIISGKLGDVDGVSLEVDKWIEVLTSLGHEVFTIAGFYRQPVRRVPEENQITLESIGFHSEKQTYYEKIVFPHLSPRPPHLSPSQIDEIQSSLESLGTDVGNSLYEILQNYSIDVIIGENTNAMPMSLLAGIAIYNVTIKHRMATIFHHHDFWWERSRFSNSLIDPLLNRIMPPGDLGTEHVVISSYASHILKALKRINPRVIPNCEDFTTPTVKDEWNSDFRKEMGFSADDILVIQPTRIILRKRIEDSVRLIKRLKDKYPDIAPRIRFVISLYQGDEIDNNYIEKIKTLTAELNIPLHFISDRVVSSRGHDSEERKLYTTRDALVHSDLATYLPVWEGFGNAFMEAVSCRVPVVTATYLVYKTDIQGAGFQVPEIRDRYDEAGHLVIPDDVLEKIYKILTDKKHREKMVNHNFHVGKKEFGFQTLTQELSTLIDDYEDEIKASRRRLAKSLLTYSV